MKLPDTPMNAGKEAPAVLAGLLVLVAAIAVAVPALSTMPKAPAEKVQILTDHEAILYFIDAELMAKPLRPGASCRWSHFPLEVGSDCKPLGGGVWYAHGTVDDPPGHLIPWRVYFLAGEGKPLYVEVGDRRSGDENRARIQVAPADLNESAP